MGTMPMKFSFSRDYGQDRGEMASEVRRPSALSWQLKAAGDNRGKAATHGESAVGQFHVQRRNRARGWLEGIAEGQLQR